MQFGTRKDNLITSILKGNNTLHKLILINVLIYIIVGIIEVVFILFKLKMPVFYSIWNNLSLSALPHQVILKPWTLLTYMFMHSGFFHILFNMLMLYWFGKIFMDYLFNRKLLTTYILGGLSGALLYLLAYQFIPYLQERAPMLGMVGASASVVAIIVATATLLPNYQVMLMFIGAVKLKYIAIVLVLIDVLSLKGTNTGGHFAHLGGALYGFIYVVQLQKGRDIGAWLGVIFDAVFKFIIGLFRPAPRTKPFKVYRNEDKTPNQPHPNKQTRPDPKIIDDILDKIAKSGYESLSEKEKDILFNASKKV